MVKNLLFKKKNMYCFSLKKEYIYQGNLILVNREHEIKEQIKEYNLKSFNDFYSDILLDYNANIELQNVLKEINAGNNIVPVSGYRSLKEQTDIYNQSLNENGIEFTKKYVAYPNCSEHQTGLAIDLGLNKENIDFIRPEFPHTGICDKFRIEAIKHGFIQRYEKEKEKITNISSEEWHFRYVGYPHSIIMYNNNFCLEEYIDYLKNFRLHNKTLNYENYEICYINMDEDIKEIEVNENESISISGNNVDGIIITKRKK